MVADDCPSDATRRVVDAMRMNGGAELRYVAVTGAHGPAAAQCGAGAARGAVIAFTDDDCMPRPDWLAAGLRAIAAADAVTGAPVVPLPEKPTDYQRDTAGLAQAAFITANCFCRRDALEEIGGFDERFTSACARGQRPPLRPAGTWKEDRAG